MKIITKVLLSKFAEKQLLRLPRNIQEALQYWAGAVERSGIREIRKLRGYHD